MPLLSHHATAQSTAYTRHKIWKLPPQFHFHRPHLGLGSQLLPPSIGHDSAQEPMAHGCLPATCSMTLRCLQDSQPGAFFTPGCLTAACGCPCRLRNPQRRSWQRQCRRALRRCVHHAPTASGTAEDERGKSRGCESTMWGSREHVLESIQHGVAGSAAPDVGTLCPLSLPLYWYVCVCGEQK